MFIPKPFEVTDSATLHDFMEAHPFALLVSRSNETLAASHLPVLLDRNQGRSGTIVGHMARENPQGRSSGGEEVLVIFSGPHAYVSPAWYEEENVVPTWNYVAVHAYGTLSLTDDDAGTMHILQNYVERFERGRSDPWTFDSTTRFAQQLAKQVVGFTVEIERLEGKWKLSQNHSTERRRKVAEALRKGDGDHEQQIARLLEMPLDLADETSL